PLVSFPTRRSSDLVITARRRAGPPAPGLVRGVIPRPAAGVRQFYFDYGRIDRILRFLNHMPAPRRTAAAPRGSRRSNASLLRGSGRDANPAVRTARGDRVAAPRRPSAPFR